MKLDKKRICLQSLTPCIAGQDSETRRAVLVTVVAYVESLRGALRTKCNYCQGRAGCHESMKLFRELCGTLPEFTRKAVKWIQQQDNVIAELSK